MMGYALGYAACGRHDVNICVAVIIAAEGNPLAVRGEFGEDFHAFGRAELAGKPTLLGHCPDISGIDKDNLLCTHIRKT